MSSHSVARRDPRRPPAHPGAFLREFVLPDLDRSMSEIARSLGISRQLLYSIVNEKAPVSPEVAVRLGKLCGNGPRLWVNMQAAHDLWHAERNVDVSRIPTLAPPREAAE
ncbi:MAG: HigA family addiction module antitoxin [Bauldia sp.]